MSSSAAAAIRFGRAAPTITVVDLPRALGFYTGVLGFDVTFENGDPVGFVILKRDAAEIHLSRSGTHHATSQNVAHLLVDDAQAFYTHLVAQDVQVVKRIRDADHGMRGFVIADPDGNRLDVGQDL
jgi:catechol 2,3-dioxygenase-like lactoylglutathione lyase family enzyme